MDGKTFIEYEKYKDNNNKIKFPKINKESLPFFIFAFIGFIALMYMISLVFPSPKPEPTNPLIFIIFCIGISWVIHGVGFVIIKR